MLLHLMSCIVCYTHMTGAQWWRKLLRMIGYPLTFILVLAVVIVLAALVVTVAGEGGGMLQLDDRWRVWVCGWDHHASRVQMQVMSVVLAAMDVSIVM